MARIAKRVGSPFPAMAASCRASRPSRRCANFCARPAGATPRAVSCRATPRRAPMSGSKSQMAQRAILMISPARPDGPPIRYGKSYSAIARLAENVTPFRRHGRRAARAGALGAGNLRLGSRRRPADHRGSWPRGRRRRERPDRRALSRSGGRARASPCAAPAGCARRSKAAAITTSRPMTSTRC